MFADNFADYDLAIWSRLGSMTGCLNDHNRVVLNVSSAVRVWAAGLDESEKTQSENERVETNDAHSLFGDTSAQQQSLPE